MKKIKTTPAVVNAALMAQGREERIRRAHEGYYYWTGGRSLQWPSIYSFSLADYTLAEILDEVRYNDEHHSSLFR